MFLVCFIAFGSFLIRNLYVYFKKNYDKQRKTIAAALVLTACSLLVLTGRYALEYGYDLKSFDIEDPDSE